MNRIVDVPLTGARAAGATKPITDQRIAHKPIQDLREWLSRVEEIGELLRIAQPVDRDEEMSAITYLVAK
jgi:hypothetical protein